MPSLPDVVTLGGYALGLWWSFGGPSWAAVVSMVLDEVDGRLARAMGVASDRGAALDWGADLVLTPLALRRLAQELGAKDEAAILAAPPVLYAQASMRADGWRPPIGSARAAIMLAALLAKKRTA